MIPAWPGSAITASTSRPSSCCGPMPAGIFPMAESADDPALYWVEPRERGIIPLEGFHVPSRLARTVRGDHFEIRIDTRFRRRHRGLRRAGATTGGRPGSTRASARSTASSSTSAMPTRSRPGATASSSAASMACGSAAPSSAKACSTRARCLEGRAGPSRGAAARGRLPPARHAIRDAASGQLRRGRRLPPRIPQAARRRRRCFTPTFNAWPKSGVRVAAGAPGGCQKRPALVVRLPIATAAQKASCA